MKTDILTSSFLKLREKLHWSALRFLKNDEDAKDAVQESFLRLCEHESYDTNPEIQNKLFLILRNICIDRLRKTPFSSLSEINSDLFSKSYDLSEDINDFELLMTQVLTDSQKEIYNHVIKEDKNYDMVAKELNMSVEAVRMSMSRIRKKIRENIKKYEL